MSSPSMAHEAGFQQARVDHLRNDQWAIVNFRHKVVFENNPRLLQDYIKGYEEYLHKVIQTT